MQDQRGKNSLNVTLINRVGYTDFAGKADNVINTNAREGNQLEQTPNRCNAPARCGLTALLM